MVDPNSTSSSDDLDKFREKVERKCDVSIWFSRYLYKTFRNCQIYRVAVQKDKLKKENLVQTLEKDLGGHDRIAAAVEQMKKEMEEDRLSQVAAAQQASSQEHCYHIAGERIQIVILLCTFVYKFKVSILRMNLSHILTVQND